MSKILWWREPQGEVMQEAQLSLGAVSLFLSEDGNPLIHFS